MTGRKTRPKKNGRNEVGDFFSGPKPWLDSKGKRTPPQILKTISKEWDEKTWTAYLDSFEEKPTEKYVHDQFLKDLLDICQVNVFDFAQDNTSINNEEDIIARALKALPAHHRQILRMTYWQNMSRGEIAKALGVPKSNVQLFLNDAQRTLRALLYAPTARSAPYEGVSETNKEAKNDQEISA